MPPSSTATWRLHRCIAQLRHFVASSRPVPPRTLRVPSASPLPDEALRARSSADPAPAEPPSSVDPRQPSWSSWSTETPARAPHRASSTRPPAQARRSPRPSSPPSRARGGPPSRAVVEPTADPVARRRRTPVPPKTRPTGHPEHSRLGRPSHRRRGATSNPKCPIVLEDFAPTVEESRLRHSDALRSCKLGSHELRSRLRSRRRRDPFLRESIRPSTPVHRRFSSDQHEYRARTSSKSGNTIPRSSHSGRDRVYAKQNLFTPLSLAESSPRHSSSENNRSRMPNPALVPCDCVTCPTTRALAESGMLNNETTEPKLRVS